MVRGPLSSLPGRRGRPSPRRVGASVLRPRTAETSPHATSRSEGVGGACSRWWSRATDWWIIDSTGERRGSVQWREPAPDTRVAERTGAGGRRHVPSGSNGASSMFGSTSRGSPDREISNRWACSQRSRTGARSFMSQSMASASSARPTPCGTRPPPDGGRRPPRRATAAAAPAPSGDCPRPGSRSRVRALRSRASPPPAPPGARAGSDLPHSPQSISARRGSISSSAARGRARSAGRERAGSIPSGSARRTGRAATAPRARLARRGKGGCRAAPGSAPPRSIRWGRAE